MQHEQEQQKISKTRKKRFATQKGKGKQKKKSTAYIKWI